MADLVKFTIDGRELEAAPGTLVIEAAKRSGIEIPSFCYYEGYSLQAACRMCLVEVEKMPKMQVACTLPVSAGMVVHTDTAQVRGARKSTLEFLLTNHPSTVRFATKAASANCRTWCFATARARAGSSRTRFTSTSSSGRQWCSMTARAAFSASDVCAFATKAWVWVRWASS